MEELGLTKVKHQRFTIGYIELEIKDKDGEFALEQNAHHWPRGFFNLASRPNSDKTFTCNLMLPLEGEHSWSQFKT